MSLTTGQLAMADQIAMNPMRYIMDVIDAYPDPEAMPHEVEGMLTYAAGLQLVENLRGSGLSHRTIHTVLSHHHHISLGISEHGVHIGLVTDGSNPAANALIRLGGVHVDHFGNVDPHRNIQN